MEDKKIMYIRIPTYILHFNLAASQLIRLLSLTTSLKTRGMCCAAQACMHNVSILTQRKNVRFYVYL